MNKIQNGIFRLIAASCIGSTLEFYDFAVYAFFSSEIAQAFFPSGNHINSLVTTFSVFAVGYLARPIGGIIFSHLGDKFGRKNNFSTSILLMASATFLMGLVPTYASIGALGSYIFIGLRLLQGLSLGAETPGALTYIAESVPQRQGLWCGVVFAFMNLGAVLAMLCHGIIDHLLSTQEFTAWGWRLPFLLGGILGVVGFIIRRNMAESIAFKKQQWKAEIPLIALFQFYPLRLFAAILIACLAGTTVALLYLYMPTYMQSILGYHPNIINLNGIYGLILYTIMINGLLNSSC